MSPIRCFYEDMHCTVDFRMVVEMANSKSQLVNGSHDVIVWCHCDAIIVSKDSCGQLPVALSEDF